MKVKSETEVAQLCLSLSDPVDCRPPGSFVGNPVFPSGSDGKESTCNVGDLGSTPGLGGSPGGGHDNPLQYSGLENSMDCIVYGVAKSRTQLSDFHFTTKQQRAFQVALMVKNLPASAGG